MTTFDLAQIQDFVANLDARMGPDLNGARDDLAELATALHEHGELCYEFAEKVREWGRAVFGGWIEFDPAVETIVRAEGAQLSTRAEELRQLVLTAQAADASLPGVAVFQTQVAWLNRLFTNWVRPQLAVGPAARHRRNLSPEVIEEARRRIAALPSLPADWPFTEEQRQALGLK